MRKPQEEYFRLTQPFVQGLEQQGLFAKFVTNFPYPIQIYKPNGTLVFANGASLNIFNLTDADNVIGKYNLLEDPDIKKWGISEYLIRAFKGEVIYIKDIKVPVQELMDKFSNGEVSCETLYQNITIFPIYGENKELVFLGCVFITSRVYPGREEIIKGKEYIESHWVEEFNLEAAAKASELSKTHFTRSFKKYTGLTPHDYYVNLKINMIKDNLLNNNFSISQVFSECGVDYNGHYAKRFKERVGMTPSEYRKIHSKER